MKAFLKNYRQSPRKVRLVGDAVKGKRVADAMVYLSFLPKRAALPMQKLLASAVANAKQAGENTGDLVVASVRIDKGIVLKRMMPRARGSAFRINKRTSHITLTLASKAPKAEKKAEKVVKAKVAAKPKAKKAATKKTDK